MTADLPVADMPVSNTRFTVGIIRIGLRGISDSQRLRRRSPGTVAIAAFWCGWSFLGRSHLWPRRPSPRGVRPDRIVAPMRTYQLYLESGPQKKTTLVHVIDLLGCVANGKTTDEALAATPDAIRAYLTYLKRHGEEVDPREPFATTVAEHITKGDFLGQGSPHAVYAPDLRPLGPRDLERVLPWLEWSRADLLALVEGIDDRRLRAKPERARAR